MLIRVGITPVGYFITNKVSSKLLLQVKPLDCDTCDQSILLIFAAILHIAYVLLLYAIFIYLCVYYYAGTSAFRASESILYERALLSLKPLSPILSSISIDTLSPFAKLCGASPTKSGLPALVPSLLPV